MDVTARPNRADKERGKSPAWLSWADGSVRWLDLAVTTLGRTAPRNVVIDDSFVSSSHAMIERLADGGYQLVDLHSTNGTTLDGRRVLAPIRLHEGARIGLGNTVLVFHCLTQRPRDEAERPLGTALQSFDGDCWLLLTDLVGFSQVRQKRSAEEAESLVRGWVSRLLMVLQHHDGVLNSQVGDAMLGYWKAKDVPRAVVADGLTELENLQRAMAADLPFRIVLHYGRVQLGTDAVRAEQLTGAPVDFLFRVEKLTKRFGCGLLVTERAARELESTLELNPLGEAPVDSFEGTFRFFSTSGGGADSPILK